MHVHISFWAIAIVAGFILGILALILHSINVNRENKKEIELAKLRPQQQGYRTDWTSQPQPTQGYRSVDQSGQQAAQPINVNRGYANYANTAPSAPSYSQPPVYVNNGGVFGGNGLVEGMILGEMMGGGFGGGHTVVNETINETVDERRDYSSSSCDGGSDFSSSSDSGSSIDIGGSSSGIDFDL